ncbi:DUF2281 domain-containing protein [Thiofaba sp. EF100]|uniref:DUF2281 domain-containing protein n=1 Tax=Thiofaba sp. EF100 TaxID=3121274 RepID=UPI0032216CED
MGWAELIQEQVKSLPEDQAKEVLDFIGYLKERREQQAWADLVQAQQSSLAGLWDQPGEEVWDHV